MVDPTLSQVISFIRECQALDSSTAVDGSTRLEADLGITGDDGFNLLQQAERRFNAALCDPITGFRPAFDLRPDDYLFRSEGHSFLIEALNRSIRGTRLGRWLGVPKYPYENVTDLTVDQLHAAISRTARKPGSEK